MSLYRAVAQEVVFVDDDPGNVERARSRGIKAVLFLDEDQCINEIESSVGHPPFES
jgi:FMN phosphatase YigB (HAD superfamily)